jgi:hypothetical protein
MGEYWHSILVASGSLIVEGGCVLMMRSIIMMHKMLAVRENHSCPTRDV